METTTEEKIEVTYSEVDRLFSIIRNGEDLHAQLLRPTKTDIIEAYASDDWMERFKDMREGKRVRVSARIYWDMLGSVPPLKYTGKSFYCGEAYSGNKHYFFELDEEDGKRYGQLKELTNA